MDNSTQDNPEQAFYDAVCSVACSLDIPRAKARVLCEMALFKLIEVKAIQIHKKDNP